MADREKVIEHITDCVRIADCQINHNWVFVRTEILKDAIALLKALDVTPEELERLKMCRHECKIDCLLEHYNKVKDELDTMKKAQEPRVITLDELRMNEVYWAEQEDISRPWPIAMHHIRNAGLLDGPVYQDYMGDNYNTKEYGKKWRCWTSRPTDAQREATPWERLN